VHDEFNTSLVVRIDWADLDLFGHVNNVAFFRYVQAARVNYCDQVGLSSTDPSAAPGFMVASSTCDFKKPLKYPGEITVLTRVDWMKNTSFRLQYVIRDQAGDICGEAGDVIVVYDHSKGEKMAITSGLRETICAVEGHSF
jgi:acyl-CoA thioester hydrolase